MLNIDSWELLHMHIICFPYVTTLPYPYDVFFPFLISHYSITTIKDSSTTKRKRKKNVEGKILFPTNHHPSIHLQKPPAPSPRSPLLPHHLRPLPSAFPSPSVLQPATKYTYPILISSINRMHNPIAFF